MGAALLLRRHRLRRLLRRLVALVRLGRLGRLGLPARARRPVVDAQDGDARLPRARLRGLAQRIGSGRSGESGAIAGVPCGLRVRGFHGLSRAKLPDSQILVSGFLGPGLAAGSPAGGRRGVASGSGIGRVILGLERNGSGGDLALQPGIGWVGILGLVVRDPVGGAPGQDLFDLVLCDRFGIGLVALGQQGLGLLERYTRLGRGFLSSLSGHRQERIDPALPGSRDAELPQPGQPDGGRDGGQAEDHGRNRRQVARQEAAGGVPQAAAGGLREGPEQDREAGGGPQEPGEVPRHAVVEPAEVDTHAHRGDAEGEQEGRGVTKGQDDATRHLARARGALLGQPLDHRHDHQQRERRSADDEDYSQDVGAQGAFASLVIHRCFPD